MTVTPPVPADDAIVGVVVHYGDPELTERAVQSLLAAEPTVRRVVVVDNGPSAFIPRTTDRVRVERPDRNLGFARAVNVAVRAEPSASAYWLLNNDALALPGALGALLDASKEHDGALASSVVSEESGAIWFERAAYLPWRMHTRHEVATRRHPRNVERTRSWRRVPYLPGTSLLVPRSVINRVGLLDESFFLYGEDVDYCVRALDAGVALVVASGSLVVHAASSGTSRPERERMIAAATLRLTRRYYPWLVLPGAVLSVGSALRRAIRQREPRLPLYRLLGFADALLRRSRGDASGAWL